MDWIRKVPIGQYVPGGSSWLRRIDPRLKLLWVLLFLLSPILAGSIWRLGLVLALLIITFLSFLPLRIWWRSLLLLLILSSVVGALATFLPTSDTAATLSVRSSYELPNATVVSSQWELIKIGPIKLFDFVLGPLVIDQRSAELGIKSSTLLFTVVHCVNLMLITTRPEDVVWALRWFIAPFSKLGLPVEKISFQLLLSLRFLPLVQEEFQNLMRSLATRAVNYKKLGLKGSIGLIISIGERLLANILLRAEQGADSLLARSSSWLPAEYFRPKDSLIRLSLINSVSIFLLFATLLLRIVFGSL